MQQVSMQVMLFLVAMFLMACSILARAWQTTTAKVLAFFLGTSSAAFAAVPAGVASAINDAQADVTSVGGLILIVVVSIAAIMWIRHVLR
jgi:hypothetical protein